MARPEMRSRRQLDPEQEARINSYSATPDTAPVVDPTLEPAAPATVPATATVDEPKSKGFNYRMTPSRHAIINAMRKEEDRSFQWMLDKLIDQGIEAWKNRG